MSLSPAEALYGAAATARMTGPGGELGSPILTPTRWRRPDRVEADRDRITWFISNERTPKRCAAEPELLWDFVQIADADATAVARFARRWGTLSDLDHPMLSMGDEASDDEPLEQWRREAGKVASALRIAAGLHNGREPDLDAWTAFDGVTVTRTRGRRLRFAYETPIARGFIMHNELVVTAGEGVAFIVSGWLSGTAAPALHMTWGERPQVGIRARGMMSAVLTQVAVAISRADGLATCTACGDVHVPKRRTVRTYCDKCGRREAQRLARRRYKDRQRAKRGTDR